MIASTLKINKQRTDRVTILFLEGSLESGTVRTLKTEIDQLLGENIKNVILDLGKVDMVDSSGIGAIVFLLKRFRPGGGDVKIAALNSNIEHIFRITKLYRAFDIFPDVSQALKSIPR